MGNFTFIAALLCTASWISVSLSEFLTVEVQHGEQVTLMCNNFTSNTSHVFGYRLTCGASVSCISSMFNCDSKVLFCDGFHNDTFDMTSNTTNIFLNIKTVDVSDSGPYFCGCCRSGPSLLVSLMYLKVQEKSDGYKILIGVILGGLTVFLVMVIIGQIVKLKKLQKADEDEDPQPSENLGSDDLNYATVAFAKKGRRGEEMEPNVVYAATR